MSRAIAIMVGLILTGHGILGLFVEDQHLFGMFNTDIALDLLYIAVGVAALLAGIPGQAGLTRFLLLGVSGVLLLVAIVALADADLLGLAPMGFTGPDFIVFFGLGGAAGIAALLPHAGAPIHQYDQG